MRKYLQLQWVLILSLFVVACGPSLKVSSDYDKEANFSKYKTFQIFHAEKMDEAISQLNQNRIINSIRNEMVKKGFTEATANPDLLVNAVAIFKDKVSVSASTNYYGYGGVYRPYYWGGAGMASSSTNYNVDHYKDGSLIIDVIDAATQKLIWQGTGNKEIDKPAKDLDAAVSKAVESIMASFPPGAAKKK